MDKVIKKSMEDIKRKVSKEESSLIRKDKKRDKACDKAMKFTDESHRLRKRK